MAHSYIQAHREEFDAFEHFARAQPRNATLLIDTYDTEAAAQRVVDLAARLASEGIAIHGVRLDSGDLAEHARRVRTVLDKGGMPGIAIFASGNLDEYRLRDLMQSGAPIDGFDIGTWMNTSADAPYLDCAYKLVEYAGEPRRKRSESKTTWPGCKQVFRRYDDSGRIADDCLALDEETHDGVPLLHHVMCDGRSRSLPSLEDSRVHVGRELATLPERLRALEPTPPLRASVSDSLAELVARLDRD
ncbi:MAG: Nicotinate phosphoribosyltransferase (EC [uncultured Caballeronia sp.]|nr:MAG: Nicotinate phosphoribosyltransferase (EC [uncultured Caballeronia sp.]